MSDRRRTRRQYPRYNVDLKVTASIGKDRFDARTRDISRAGICLVGMRPLDRDAEITLNLVLTFGSEGASEPLALLGRVAWCTAMFGAYQIGIKFVKVDQERARYLDMFVGFLDGTLAPGPTSDDDDAKGSDDPFAA